MFCSDSIGVSRQSCVFPAAPDVIICVSSVDVNFVYFVQSDMQITRVTKMLADEYGTASNIKSRVNRLSVLSAITSAQQRLKLYNKVHTSLSLVCARQLSSVPKLTAVFQAGWIQHLYTSSTRYMKHHARKHQCTCCEHHFASPFMRVGVLLPSAATG